jgi:hypothetical protein
LAWRTAKENSFVGAGAFSRVSSAKAAAWPSIGWLTLRAFE